MDSLDYKIDYINNMATKTSLDYDDWNIIGKLVKDEDSEVRCRIAEMLAQYPIKISEDLLKSMINDNEPLVRVNVCDSLAFSKSIEILYLLMKSANDHYFLVRGYAVLSIGDIQSNIGVNSYNTVEFLRKLYDNEKSEWVKIAISRSLYLLNDFSGIGIILDKLSSKCYQHRILTLNVIDDIIESNKLNNINEISDALESRVEIEKVLHIKSKIKELLAKIHF